ncbi:unnamed protein product, partial [Mesorhabditis spiculigera]
MAESGVAMLSLTSSDQMSFKVKREVAETFAPVSTLLQDLSADYDAPIPVMGVTGEILKIVIGYTEQHIEAGPRQGKTLPWETTFVSDNKDKIYELLLAANYLDVKPLLDLLCEAVAAQIRGKNSKQIREHFGLPENEE